jgi:cell division protein FtsB
MLGLLGLAVLLAGRFLVADDAYPALKRLRTEIGGVEADNARLRSENEVLRASILSLRHDLHTVERLAREDLDFAAAGETIYLFPTERPTPPER